MVGTIVVLFAVHLLGVLLRPVYAKVFKGLL